MLLNYPTFEHTRRFGVRHPWEALNPLHLRVERIRILYVHAQCALARKLESSDDIPTPKVFHGAGKIYHILPHTRYPLTKGNFARHGIPNSEAENKKNEVEVRQTFLPLTVPKKTFLKHCREKQISADYAFVLWKCGKLRNWFREIPSISGTFWEKSGPRPGSCLENSLRTHAGYRCLQRMTVLPNFFVMPGRKQTWKGLLKSCNIVTGEYIVNQLVT